MWTGGVRVIIENDEEKILMVKQEHPERTVWMVPGGGIYYTMEYCIQGNMPMFIEKLVTTLGVAGAIAVGVSLVSSFVRIFTINKFENQQYIENYYK